MDYNAVEFGSMCNMYDEYLNPTCKWGLGSINFTKKLTANNFNECNGTTRSSWSAVNNMVDGYCVDLSGSCSHGLLTLCRGEYLKSKKEKLKMSKYQDIHLPIKITKSE